MHGQHPRDGDALLLAAGQFVGRVPAVLIHTDGPETFLHPLPDFFRGNSHVLRSKAHILLHYLSDDLIVRILKYHTRSLPDIPDMLFFRSIHSVHPHSPLRRIQDGIDMLGQSGFSGTVMAQDGDKFPCLNVQVDLVHGSGDALYISLFIPSDIFIHQLLCPNDSHIYPLFALRPKASSHTVHIILNSADDYKPKSLLSISDLQNSFPVLFL